MHDACMFQLTCIDFHSRPWKTGQHVQYDCESALPPCQSDNFSRCCGLVHACLAFQPLDRQTKVRVFFFSFPWHSLAIAIKAKIISSKCRKKSRRANSMFSLLVSGRLSAISSLSSSGGLDGGPLRNQLTFLKPRRCW